VSLPVTRVDVFLTCLLLGIFYLLWRIDQLHRRLGDVERDSLLHEVMWVTVQLRREYFLEALGLSDEETDGAPHAVRGIGLRLSIWKAHYSGEVVFFRGPGEEPKRESIFESPTFSSQFPLEVARCCLFRDSDENQDTLLDFGPKSPEKLEVLLSHKAIIIRTRDGRFEWGVSGTGHLYKPRPSDVVIPIREDDLFEYLDTYGRDDADFLMMMGDARRYKRDGRWATWNITAVYPKPFSRTTTRLDQSAVKPNDRDKIIDDTR